jgi:hypothetical protein
MKYGRHIFAPLRYFTNITIGEAERQATGPETPKFRKAWKVEGLVSIE